MMSIHLLLIADSAYLVTRTYESTTRLKRTLQ